MFRVIVVDANIILPFFSAKSFTRKLIVHLFLGGCRLIAPEYAFLEIEDKKEIIKKKFSLTERQFYVLLSVAKKIIQPIGVSEFRSYLEKAKAVSPDPKDVEYFALALKFSCPIWSNDKRLKQQDKVLVLSTEEIAKLFAE